MTRFIQSPVLLFAAGLFCTSIGVHGAEPGQKAGARVSESPLQDRVAGAQAGPASSPLPQVSPGVQTAQFEWDQTSATTLTLKDKGLPVLAYNFGLMSHAGVPEKRWRSGYIHPIYSVDGTTVLTDDFPSDHPHHRGLFWAWPKITINGVLYDLWQYDKAPITQRFERWIEQTITDSSAILEVENGWYVDERKVMDETVRLYVRQRTTEGRSMSLEIRLTPTTQAVTLAGADGKGYGGLSLRLAVKNEADCSITTQKGAERKDLLEAPLSWAGISNKYPGLVRPQGITLSVAPGHTEPGPMWMTRHYGCLCAGWPGTQARTLQIGETVVLKYQVLVHEGNSGDIQ